MIVWKKVLALATGLYKVTKIAGFSMNGLVAATPPTAELDSQRGANSRMRYPREHCTD